MEIPWTKVDFFVENFSSEALMSYRACPVCESVRSTNLVMGLNDFQFYSDSAEFPKRMNIRQNKCLNCGTVYMNPCYSKWGFEVLFDESGKTYGAPKWKYEKRAAWIIDNVTLWDGANILDLGCYDGTLLSLLPESFKKTGVDIDQHSLNTGKKNYPHIHFVKADLEGLSLDIKPDAMTMFHVLEHLPNPASVLRNLHSISHEDTNFIIEVPIIEKGATPDISGFFSITHLTHFSTSSLKHLLHSTGWQVLKWEVEPSYNGLRVLAKSRFPHNRPEIGSEEVGLLYDYLAKQYRNLMNVEQQLSKAACEKLCVIWGAGLHTELLYQLSSFFRRDADRRFVIVDSDRMKWGKSWRGIPICKPAILKNIDWNKSSLVISSYASQTTIEKAAKDLGVPKDKLINMYDISD